MPTFSRRTAYPNRSKLRGMRSRFKIILDFERIFEMLPEKARNKPELLEHLLKLLMAFSIEIKRGMMLPEDIKNFKEGFMSAQIEQSQLTMNLRNAEGKNRSEIEEKYYLNNKIIKCQERISSYTRVYGYELLFPSEVWWQTFFDKGIVDIQEFEQSLPNSKYFQDESRPNWVNLWYYRNFRDDQLNDLIEKVELDYFCKRITVIGVIKHVIGILLTLSYNGLYQKTQEEILQESKSYVDKLRASGQLDLSNTEQFNSSPLDDIGHDGLGFHGREFKEFQEFGDYIVTITKSARAERLSIIFEELLDMLQNNIERLCEMLSGSYYDMIEKECHDSILKYIEPCVFANRILSIKFEDQNRIFQALSRRYRFDYHNEKLLQESEWLKSFQELLLEEANNKKGKVSGYNLEQLNKDYLINVIEEIEKIESQK